MTPREAAQVYALIAAAWPAWKATDATLDLWVMMLADVDYDAAVEAVRAMVATDEGWPSVAKLRREVARQAGELAPELDQAWGEVVHAAARVGRAGRPEWSHPAVASAVASLGWSAICNSDRPDVIRGQFARIYQTCAERDTRAAVEPGGRIALGGDNVVPLPAPGRALGHG